MCQRGSSSMNFDCPTCHARYYVDPALFKGAKGMRVRCRRCGNSLYVLIPDNSGIEPAISLAGQEQSTPPEMEWMLPEGEPAPHSQGNAEEEESWEELFRKPLPVSAYPHAPRMFYPPFPKSSGKARSRTKLRWSSLIFLCVFLFFVVGGSAYLIFTPLGKGILADIGQDLANTVTLIRS